MLEAALARRFTYCGATFEAIVVDGKILEVRPCHGAAAPERDLEMEKLSGLELEFSGCSEFDRSVLEKVKAIPRGRVATYGELARAVGKPGAARAVGGVMARNRLPIVVPCHRVIRSDMRPGDYSNGVALKVQLLRSEGVEFVGNKISKKFLHRF